MEENGKTRDGKSGKQTIGADKPSKVQKDKTGAEGEMLVGDGKETDITTKIATEVKSYLADDGIIDNAQDNVNATLKSLTKQ